MLQRPPQSLCGRQRLGGHCLLSVLFTVNGFHSPLGSRRSVSGTCPAHVAQEPHSEPFGKNTAWASEKFTLRSSSSCRTCVGHSTDTLRSTELILKKYSLLMIAVGVKTTPYAFLKSFISPFYFNKFQFLSKSSPD